MILLNPLLLAGLGAIAVPVLLHLLFREKPKPVHIPTVRFIQRAVQRARASQRLVKLLLLLVRILFIASIVLALTRPVWQNSPLQESGHGKVAAVIILDDSFYAAQLDAGATQLAAAKNAAQAYLQRMTSGSKVALSTTSTLAGGLTIDLDYIRGELARLQPGTVDGSLRSAISSAADLLLREAPDERRLIVAVTDCNAAQLQPARGPLEVPAGCELHLVALPPRGANAHVRGVTLYPRQRITQNRKLRITATLGGGAALVERRVDLLLNGNQAASQVVHGVDAGGSTTIVFETSLTETGHLRGELRLDQDDVLSSDNVWYFTCRVGEPQRVLVLGNAAEGLQQRDLIAMALAPRGWYGRQRYQVDRANFSYGLQDRALHEYDAIILTGRCELEPQIWILLQQFVADGGALLVIPDETTVIGSLNSGAMPLLPGAFAEAAGPQSLIDAGGNALGRDLLSVVGQSLGRVAFRRFYHLDLPAAQPDTAAVLRYTDGSVAVALRRLGRGSVMAAGWVMSPDWSDLLDSEALAPALHLLLQHLLALDEISPDIICGRPYLVRADSLVPDDATIYLPQHKGAVSVAGSDFVDGRHRFDQTSLCGHYRIDFGTTSQTWFAANIHRTQDTYRHLGRSECEALVGENAQLRSPADPVVLGTTTTGRDLPLAATLIVLGMLLLAVEAQLSNGHLKHV